MVTVCSNPVTSEFSAAAICRCVLAAAACRGGVLAASARGGRECDRGHRHEHGRSVRAGDRRLAGHRGPPGVGMAPRNAGLSGQWVLRDPRLVAPGRRAERGVESLFGGSEYAGLSVKRTLQPRQTNNAGAEPLMSRRRPCPGGPVPGSACQVLPGYGGRHGALLATGRDFPPCAGLMSATERGLTSRPAARTSAQYAPGRGYPGVPCRAGRARMAAIFAFVAKRNFPLIPSARNSSVRRGRGE